MKLTEKDLRNLIKEELVLVADVNEEEEGSEVTRDATESNLHDETIVRFFEVLGLEDEDLEEQNNLVSPIEPRSVQKHTATVSRRGGIASTKALGTGAGIDDEERALIGNLRDKLIDAAKKTKITSGVAKRYMGLLARVLDKILNPGAGITGSDALAEKTNVATKEEIVNKVVEEIFKKKQ